MRSSEDRMLAARRISTLSDRAEELNENLSEAREAQLAAKEAYHEAKEVCLDVDAELCKVMQELDHLEETEELERLEDEAAKNGGAS